MSMDGKTESRDEMTSAGGKKVSSDDRDMNEAAVALRTWRTRRASGGGGSCSVHKVFMYLLVNICVYNTFVLCVQIGIHVIYMHPYVCVFVRWVYCSFLCSCINFPCYDRVIKSSLPVCLFSSSIVSKAYYS